MIDVEGGNNMLYVPLDKIMEQSGARGGSTEDLRDLANQLAPYLPGPNSINTADRSRISTGRGNR